MALDNSTTVPKIVAAQLLAKLRQSQIFGARTNSTYRSQLNAAGNEVIINTPADASITDYTANASVTYGNADVGAPVTLQLTKRKAWGVKIDDLDAAKSRPNVLQSAVAEHGVKLAEVVDKDVRDAMDSGATAGPAVAVDHSDSDLGIDDLKLSQMHRILDFNNVSRAGRFLIIDPYMAEVMQRIALKNEVLLTSSNTQGLTNGSLGTFAGFNIYVQPGAYTSINNARKSSSTGFFGVDNATAFIDRVSRTERLRLQNTFADAVRGLYEYGYKVIRPDSLYKSAMSVTKVPADS